MKSAGESLVKGRRKDKLVHEPSVVVKFPGKKTAFGQPLDENREDRREFVFFVFCVLVNKFKWLSLWL